MSTPGSPRGTKTRNRSYGPRTRTRSWPTSPTTATESIKLSTTQDTRNAGPDAPARRRCDRRGAAPPAVRSRSPVWPAGRRPPPRRSPHRCCRWGATAALDRRPAPDTAGAGGPWFSGAANSGASSRRSNPWVAYLVRFPTSHGASAPGEGLAGQAPRIAGDLLAPPGCRLDRPARASKWVLWPSTTPAAVPVKGRSAGAEPSGWTTTAAAIWPGHGPGCPAAAGHAAERRCRGVGIFPEPAELARRPVEVRTPVRRRPPQPAGL